MDLLSIPLTKKSGQDYNKLYIYKLLIGYLTRVNKNRGFKNGS